MELSDRDAIKQKVITFVGECCGYQPDELNEDTDLYRDPGVMGDDVDELFLELSEKLGLPLDKIDVRGCFPGEPHLFNPLPTLFFRLKRRVRLRHLIDAVFFKQWPELDEE
jgi:hypothetical protein